MTLVDQKPLDRGVPAQTPGFAGLLTTTDHKKIGLLTIGTALVMFVFMGALALIMRIQLAQPDQSIISLHTYNQLFTLHGSGMIYMVVTPLAIGLGVYMVPLQVGAPRIAAPRVALLGYWLFVASILAMFAGPISGGGSATTGWFSYPPLSDAVFSPQRGESLWVLAVFLEGASMILLAACVLWTALRMRVPEMTPLKIPLFTWSMIVTTLMTVAAFPSLLAAMVLLAIGRTDPHIFDHNLWVIAYQQLFWFYGHPVVYVMFFPFVGCVIETLAVFAGRRYVGYKVTVVSLLTFAALSMAVWGHHLFNSGQVANDYYSLTSLTLALPAGAEYFGFLSTIVGGRLRYSPAMLFALAFIPQFFIGGVSGIMAGTPVLDYHFNDSFFVVAHFHYTLFAGSVFGLFAGVYLWWPKATGTMLSDRLGKVHFWLMVIGTNATFLPMFALGFQGMPRRVASYPNVHMLGTLNLISTVGAFIIAIGVGVFVVNAVRSLRRRIPAPDDPWGGHSLEWATTSPPPRTNFVALPPITGFAPLYDLHEKQAETTP